jgi:acetyl esterase/lipase
MPALGLVPALLGACSESRTPDRADDTPDGSRQDGVVRITYGDDPSQLVELHRPPGASRGVVVVIHGGFWKAAYDHALGAPLARSLAERGWTAWNIEYRRVGNGGRPDPGVRVTHAISQAGVLDLVGADRAGLGGGAVAALLGHQAGPDDAQWDPQQQVPLDVPVWCVHGVDDTVVPLEQSEGYVAAARAAGAEAELVRVEGDHFVVIDPASKAWHAQLEILDGISG